VTSPLFGKVLYLPGRNQGVVIPATGLSTLTNFCITFFLNINPPKKPSGHCVFAERNGTFFTHIWAIPEGGLELAVVYITEFTRKYTKYSIVADVLKNRWQFIVIMLERHSAKLFLDGEEHELYSRSSHCLVLNCPGNLCATIGNLNSNYFYSGMISHFVVYPFILDECEIHKLYIHSKYIYVVFIQLCIILRDKLFHIKTPENVCS
jgi:hypothetical protein